MTCSRTCGAKCDHSERHFYDRSDRRRGGRQGTPALHDQDEKKNKEILKVDTPIDAQVTIGQIVIPLPEIK
jgi:hypothetical protein